MPNLTQILQKSRPGHVRHPGRNFEKFTNYTVNMRTKRWETIPNLKPRISEVRPKVGKDVLCLEEMGVVFECFKTYNYNENKCAQEIMAFNKCVGEAREKIQERMKAGGTEELGTTEDLGPKQINKLLRMYPQPYSPPVLTHYGGRPMKKPVHTEEKKVRRQTDEDR